MNVKVEKICRLCLKLVENDYEIIDETIRRTIEDLLSRVNLDISKDPIICNDCREISIRCLNFKLVFMDTEKRIFSLSADKNRVTFELKDVFNDGNNIEMLDNNFICRFCLKPSNGNNIVLLDSLMKNGTFAEKLQAHMPVMDFDVIKNPVICASCSQDLECYIGFIENCLDIEEKISKYRLNDNNPISSAQIKLYSVLPFSFNTILELDNMQTNAIKKEEDVLEDIDGAHSEVYDAELIKVEEAFDVKEEKINFDETTRETVSDVPMYELNILSELKSETEMVNAQKVSTQNSSPTSTTANYEKCTCGSIHNSGIKCDRRSDMISSETLAANAYQKKYKGAVNKRKKLLSTENVSVEKNFKCTFCTYETKQNGNLKRHILIHKEVTDVEIFKCSMCSYETRNKAGLKSHTLVHKYISEVETFKCAICTYETKHKSNLKKHSLTHKSIREVETFKCSMCAYETKHKSHLKNHTIVHKNITEVKRYKCPMCTFQAKHRSNLKPHMLIHKDVTEVEMYKCWTCSFQTKQKGILKRHILIHKYIKDVETFKCSVCTYETKQRSNLKSHTLIHKNVTEVEMFKCTVCTFETKRKSHLKRHMIIHKDVKGGSV